jgi:class 3 adenylate cyclase
VSRGAIETVSVVMTDVVGSTAIAERLGPAGAEELRREHFALLRDAVVRTGGREVKNLGDGLMVVFTSAAQALMGAVEMQRAVDARNRNAEDLLGLRVGVSLGDATVDDGDYFGEPVVEAARLCARAAGGQIVVSSQVQQIGGARGAHAFRALGELELKGISRPVQAFELQWEPSPVEGIALPERLREVPATGYVGRVRERDLLTGLWEQAREGSLRLALISGEAGVGKTRLSTFLALQAHEDGATVLYGRCDEDLGVPYQPWTQALAHLVGEAPQALLEEHAQLHGGDLARLVPALRHRLADLPAPRESDPETERYLLYAAVSGLLGAAGAQRPLLLILDDLHWADAPTLSLLRHVATSGAAIPALVLATYRDSDLARDHPLTALLADLHREQGVDRMKLAGLGAEDVLALMEALAGHALDADGRALAEEIRRETDGNPFFAVELLRHLTESGAIVHEDGGRWRVVGEVADLGLPQSVREVIGRRVDRLGPDARTALSAAAVIGREFEIVLLLAVLALDEARLLDLLDEAVASSLLRESSDRAGHFTFTHALVEHALYEDLGRTRRAALHRQVAEALELQCGEEPGERLGELAGHWAAAVVSADTTRALLYARRAAERALGQLAPDEAARWYRQALELHDQAAGERAERCELLVGLGEAQRQMGDPEARRTLLDAAALAQQLGDAEQLCRAVLANSQELAASQMGVADPERVQALEAAEAALPPRDARRAQVLALLACELHYVEPARCRELAAKAIETARAAGDPLALARTLVNAIWAIWGADTLAERQGLMDELVALLADLEDPWLRFWAAARRVGAGLEAGDRAEVESGIERARVLAAAVPQPSIAHMRLRLEAGCALLDGDLPASERWALQAYSVGTAAGEPDTVTALAAQMSMIRYFQGRLGETVEQTTRFAAETGSVASWRAAAALALLEAGREEEAHELARAEDFRAIRGDDTWPIAAIVWAVVCSRHTLEGMDALYELFAPYPRQLVATGGIVVYGSTDWALGTYALARGRHDEADGHFAASAELLDSVRAPLWLALTKAGWARTLLARGHAADVGRARVMIEEAEDVAGRLGAAGIMRATAQSRASLAALSR